jgi:hypothetical protein
MAERIDWTLRALALPPAATAGWTAAQWTAFCQQARGAGLLARAAERIAAAGDGARAPWPEGLDAHLQSAQRVIRAQRTEIDRELRHISHALADLGAPVVLLKGAAYLAAGLPAAAGRVFSDVDILVPKAALREAESRLMLGGWVTTHHNEYDQRYYRQWMHELPPMQHVHRGTTLDVHHNILPETARLKPDAARLIAAAVPLPDRPGLMVLAPTDMILHSMTHLFMNEEMGHALRDLSDMDLLLRHFAAEEGFWTRLLERACELDLARPLHYGLRHAAQLLGTPVPAELLQAAARRGPAWPLSALMDALWRRALASPHPGAARPGRAAALFMLYVRGHWLRMPPLLLARHLGIKAMRLHERPAHPTPAADAP